nr:hypothetical protein [uncultured Dyadobacter sp.]
MGKYGVIVLWLLLACVASGFGPGQRTRYFLSATLPFEAVKVRPFTFDFRDELPDDTLFQSLSPEGYPVSYHRKLRASVCFDGQCRALDVDIYWNITGRYLGIELPSGEYLSKTDHDPFDTDDYRRLNALLADPQSPLGKMSYEELVAKPPLSVKGVDAVTSATSKSVLEYIVKGAAFTTYKMWHFIYGTTRDRVAELTIQSLSPELILHILQSPDPSDRLWALNHIDDYVSLSPELSETLLKLADSENYTLSERALNAINAKHLRPEAMQLALVEKFRNGDYSKRKLLIGKLKQVPVLHSAAKDRLNSLLPQLNGELIGDVLAIYQHLKVSDPETCRIVAKLLQKENKFISSKALSFLKEAHVEDPAIRAQITRYEARTN